MNNIEAIKGMIKDTEWNIKWYQEKLDEHTAKRDGLQIALDALIKQLHPDEVLGE